MRQMLCHQMWVQSISQGRGSCDLEPWLWSRQTYDRLHKVGGHSQQAS